MGDIFKYYPPCFELVGKREICGSLESFNWDSYTKKPPHPCWVAPPASPTIFERLKNKIFMKARKIIKYFHD